MIGIRVRLSMAAAAAAMLTVALCGCGEAIHNSAEDDHYIRTGSSSDAPIPEIVASPNARLLPTQIGSRWVGHMTARKIDPSATADASEQAGTDVTTVVAQKMLPDGVPGYVVETRQSTQTKPYRVEVYTSDARGVGLTSISGQNQSMALSSPLPLIQTPTRLGDVLSWQGFVQMATGRLPAKAYSRVSAQSILSLPAGKIGAYRVDTILQVQDGSRLVGIPMTRWFAPGIGIVERRFFVGEMTIDDQLVSYHPARG